MPDVGSIGVENSLNKNKYGPGQGMRKLLAGISVFGWEIQFGLILTKNFVTIIEQRISDFTHHAAFRSKAVPVEHPALE